MESFRSLCKELGVSLAEEKTVGPTTCLVYLGLEINTKERNVRITNDKILSLLGSLKHF